MGGWAECPAVRTRERGPPSASAEIWGIIISFFWASINPMLSFRKLAKPKLIELQSRINWESCGCLGLENRADWGLTCRTTVRSSGRILCLISAVELQATRTWSADSNGAWHSLQAGLRLGWSAAWCWCLEVLGVLDQIVPGVWHSGSSF